MDHSKKGLVFTLVLCLFTSASFAQLDSLHRELQKAAGEKRVDVLNKIAFTYGYSNFDSARYFAEIAFREASEMNYLEGKLKAYINIGYSYFDEDRIDTALVLMKRCVAEAKALKLPKSEMDGYLALGIVYDAIPDLDSAAWSYRQNIAIGKSIDQNQKTTAAIGNLGNVYRQQGLYDLAIAQYMEAAELNREGNFILKQANYLSNIGSVYLELEDFQNAYEYSSKAYELVKDTDYTRLKWYARTGKSLALGNLGRVDEALAGFRQTLEEAKEINDPYQIATVLHNMADLYVDESKPEEALKYCLEALERFEKLSSPIAMVQTHNLLCRIYGNIPDPEKALDHCDKALALSKANNLSSSYRDIYKVQSEVLVKAGRYKEAYDTRLLFEKVKDEQLGIEQENYIGALETQYDTKEKELAIKIQEEQLAAQDKLIGQQRIIQLLGLMVLVVVAALAIFAWRTSKKQKVINAQLHEQKQLIEKTSQERETLLKEIHHRVKNNLQVISSLLSMQSRQMEEGEAKSAVREGQSRIKSMSLIHQKLYSQDELSRINMKEYIGELSQFLFKSYKTDNDVQEVLEAQDILLDVDTAVPLGLIINELIANALKYAFETGSSGQLKVAFTKEDQGYKLQVSDNGKGLPDGWENQQNMGMRLVNILVAQLDGHLEVANENGSSFTITFQDRAA